MSVLQSPHRLTCLLLFSLALGLRLLHWHALSGAPFAERLQTNPLGYHRMASQILDGELSREPYYQGPAYSYFLAAVYGVLGCEPRHALALQALIGALTVLGIYGLGVRLFGSRAGEIAGLMAAIYWPFIYFGGELLPVTLACALVVASLHALMSCSTDRRWCLGAGLLLGLAVLTRPNLLGFVPVAGLWIWTRSSGGRRGAALFLCVVALCIATVTARNWVHGRDRVLISRNLGINLFRGNRPGSDGMNPFHTRAEDLQNRGLATAAHSARSRFYLSRVVQNLIHHPREVFELIGRKAWLFFLATEIPNNSDIRFRCRFSWVTSMSLPGFGLLGPLFLFGLCVERRRWSCGPGRLAYLFLLVYYLTIILFFICGRFRLPIMVLGLPFAAAGLIGLSNALRSGPWREKALAGMLLLVTVGVVHWDIFGAGRTLFAPLAHNRGVWLRDEGLSQQALASFREAIQIDPKYARSHVALGRLLWKLGYLDQAEAAFLRGINESPWERLLYWHLSRMLEARGRHRLAEETMKSGLARIPDDLKGIRRLARLQTDHHRSAEAIATLRRLTEKDPGDWRAGLEIGRLMVQEQLFLTDATSVLSRVEERHGPCRSTAHLRLLLLMTQGQTERAVSVAESLDASPELPGLHYHIALAHFRAGQEAAAVRWARSVRREDPGHPAAQGLLVRLKFKLREEEPPPLQPKLWRHVQHGPKLATGRASSE